MIYKTFKKPIGLKERPIFDDVLLNLFNYVIEPSDFLTEREHIDKVQEAIDVIEDFIDGILHFEMVKYEE